jgi:hypothetical protein
MVFHALAFTRAYARRPREVSCGGTIGAPQTGVKVAWDLQFPDSRGLDRPPVDPYPAAP